MSIDEAPPRCPQCSAKIVRRVAGPWCPRCRGWLVRQEFPRYFISNGTDVAVFAWGIRILY